MRKRKTMNEGGLSFRKGRLCRPPATSTPLGRSGLVLGQEEGWPMGREAAVSIRRSLRDQPNYSPAANDLTGTVCDGPPLTLVMGLRNHGEA